MWVVPGLITIHAPTLTWSSKRQLLTFHSYCDDRRRNHRSRPTEPCLTNCIACAVLLVCFGEQTKYADYLQENVEKYSLMDIRR